MVKNTVSNFSQLVMTTNNNYFDFLLCCSGYYGLFNGLIDLFVAGMETTSTSLMWTFLYLIHHQDVQKRVHQELDEVKMSNITIEYRNFGPKNTTYHCSIVSSQISN